MMPEITIIIVSYQVKKQLTNCLQSLFAVIQPGKLDIIIVDNASTDGTCLLPEWENYGVRLIKNRDNVGFARACNQGLKEVKTKFVLFLNPDTLLNEHVIDQCLSFFKQHPDTGALGVRMVDGNGVYLKESKRGLPNLSSSFWKMTGLHRIFPRSRFFRPIILVI